MRNKYQKLSKRYQLLKPTRAPRTILLQGIRFVITPNDKGSVDVLQNQSVLIKNGKIVKMFPKRELQKQVKLEDIDLIYDDSLKGGIVLTPGFINMHTHPPMYLLRSTLTLAEANLDKALQGMAKIEYKMNDAEFELGAIGDFTEEQKSGITSSISHYGVFDPVDAAAAYTGQHVINCMSAASNSHPENTPEMVEKILKRGDSFSTPGLALHYIWKADGKVLRKVAKILKKYDTYFTLHVAESEQTVKRCIEKFGLPPVLALDKFGLLGPKTIMSHCVHLTDEEIALIKKRKATVVHLPTSNLLHRSGFFNLKAFADADALDRVTLGTDSVVSKNRLDLLTEALTTKTIHQHRHMVSYEDLFLMSTHGAANCLGLGKKLGRVAPGYTANLSFWKLKDRGLMPYDEKKPKTLISNMITHGSRSVRDLMINGEFVISDREHNLVDESKLLKDLQAAHMELRSRK